MKLKNSGIYKRWLSVVGIFLFAVCGCGGSRATATEAPVATATNTAESGESLPQLYRIHCRKGNIAACRKSCELGDRESCAKASSGAQAQAPTTTRSEHPANAALEALVTRCQTEPVACSQLGWALWEGKLGEHTFAKQPVRASQYLQRACHANLGEGCQMLGMSLVERDRVQAVEAWQRGCRLNNALSCYALGYHAEVLGIDAARWYRRACQLNLDEACGKLPSESAIEWVRFSLPAFDTVMMPSTSKQECTQEGCKLRYSQKGLVIVAGYKKVLSLALDQHALADVQQLKINPATSCLKASSWKKQAQTGILTTMCRLDNGVNMASQYWRRGNLEMGFVIVGSTTSFQHALEIAAKVQSQP